MSRNSRFPGIWPRWLTLGLLVTPLLFAAPAAFADAGRLAFVQPDGSLRIGTRIVRLYGIYIPQTERTCRTFLRPVKCGPRAALELDFKVHGFVYCDTVSRNRDGSVSAICRVESNDPSFGPREDLAAFLLREGWAVALPGAPFEYVTWERIARAHHRGIWGFQVDSITGR